MKYFILITAFVLFSAGNALAIAPKLDFIHACVSGENDDHKKCSEWLNTPQNAPKGALLFCKTGCQQYLQAEYQVVNGANEGKVCFPKEETLEETSEKFITWYENNGKPLAEKFAGKALQNIAGPEIYPCKK